MTITEYLNRVYPIRGEIALHFIGAPGIGKTQMVQQFAKKKGVNCITMMLSTMEASDIDGIMVYNAEEKVAEVMVNKVVKSLKDGDILFMDELTNANRSVMNAVLTFILDRRTPSGYELPNIMIVAASNPPEFGTNEMMPQHKQRFANIVVGIELNSWKKYMLGKYPKYYETINNVTMASFSNGDDFNDVNRINYMTPRSIEKVLQLLQDSKCEITDVMDIARGLTGESDAKLTKLFVPVGNSVTLNLKK